MIRQRRFRIVAGAGTGLLAAFTAMVVFAGAAFPFFLGNIGSFLVRADRLEGQSFDLALALDPNSSSSGGNLPAGEISLSNAEIRGLVLEKTFDLGAVLGTGGNATWKLRISVPPTEATTIQNLKLQTVGLCAQTLELSNFNADGKGANTDTVTDDLSIGANSVTIVNAGIEATSLTSTALTLNGVTVEVVNEGYDAPSCLPNR
jgi:hypothetical protein